MGLGPPPSTETHRPEAAAQLVRWLRTEIRYPAGMGAGPWDTVWLDVSGCARIFGGEESIAAELCDRAEQLGHRARVVIADGPRIAQSLARWSSTGWVRPVIRGRGGQPAPPARGGSGRCADAARSVRQSSTGLAERTGADEAARNLSRSGLAAGCLGPLSGRAFTSIDPARELAALPSVSLPLEPRLLGWLGKLGILTIGELARLDRARLAHRLGPHAHDLLELVAGRDGLPLIAHEPPRVIVEEASFEHELHGTEPLLFVLRGLMGRAATRLEARGEACQSLHLTLRYDPAHVRLERRLAGTVERHLAEELAQGGPRDVGRVLPAQLPLLREGSAGPQVPPQVSVEIALPLPLHDEDELLRALRARLDRLVLQAPVVATVLTLDGLVPAPRAQLALSRKKGPLSLDRKGAGEFPLLLAELSGQLGEGRVGVLRVGDSHRPEARSELVPIDPSSRPAAPQKPENASAEPWSLAEPTRLLPHPIEIHERRPRPGGLLPLSNRLYLVDRVEQRTRIDGVEWWTPEPVRRDYARLTLHAGEEHTEAWVYRDRHSGRCYLHGWFE